MTSKISEDPMGAFYELRGFLQKYVTSAFGTNSSSFEEERQRFLDEPGFFFQQPILEPLPEYLTEKHVVDLDSTDHPSLTRSAEVAFKNLVSCSLVPQEFRLYKHQQRMLSESLRGKHAVVVTGTGSGKTEAFLLPVLAQICKEAFSEGRPWPKLRSRNRPKWDMNHLPAWSDTASALRGEDRTPAVRALILYPMNALVEDQISRLRSALDSDQARAVFEEDFGGNRIRFGRFNGSTPVAGHPVQSDENGNVRANTSKRTELRDRLQAAIRQSSELDRKINDLEQRLRDASSRDDPDVVAHIAKELDAALEQRSFIPRLDLDSSEMFHRWEMQKSPRTF